jgi:D-beta-D-heptose 7-phosphate kinase/D-beta-D-heptose 1-phosphate adenosyltransferase
MSKIITLKDFSKIRHSLGSIVCASGGFDPLHPGHTNYIIDSKKFAKTLVVIVNGDNFLFHKKGYSVMNLEDRCMVISSIKNVDYVIPYEINNDLTVIEALKIIKPNFFTKGGDRNSKNNIPEWEICKALNIEIKLKVGVEKVWSSTKIINDVIEKHLTKHRSQ